MTTPKKKRNVVKVNAMAYAHLVKALFTGDHNCDELAEITGLHKLTVYQYCRELHKVKAVHICRRDPDRLGRHTVKVYKLGEAKDAPRVRMTGAERQAATRARAKAKELTMVMGGSAKYVQAANGRLRFERVAA